MAEAWNTKTHQSTGVGEWAEDKRPAPQNWCSTCRLLVLSLFLSIALLHVVVEFDIWSRSISFAAAVRQFFLSALVFLASTTLSGLVYSDPISTEGGVEQGLRL